MNSCENVCHSKYNLLKLFKPIWKGISFYVVIIIMTKLIAIDIVYY